jgi:multicomponent Na+:H+ antiporter subunit D
MESFILLSPLLLLFAGVALTIFLRKKPKTQAIAALILMLAALGFSIAQLVMVLQAGHPLVAQMGLWPAPMGITLIADPLSVFMLLMTHIVLSAGLLYAMGSIEKVIHYPMFYPIFLALGLGLTGAFLTGDLFNLFVFAEVVVIAGSVLTAIADDKSGVEAAYKYFYISTLAAVFFLLGIGSLYVAHGTLNLADLASRIPQDPAAPLTLAGLAFLTATFLTKSAAFPFHFWQPDFHAAAPTPISAMLSSVVVKLGVYGLLRLTTLVFVSQADALRMILIIVGVIGVVYGGLGATGTHNAKRMLAYSTLAQVGFILTGVGWGTSLSLAAALVFAFNHALVKAALLMLVGAMASRAPVKSAAFEVLVGIGKASPFAGFLFLLGGMALAGIPPLNGFISKLMFFWSGVEAAQYLPLALIGVASIITLTYVIRTFIRIWFEVNPESKTKPGDRLAAPAILVGLSLVLGVWGQPLVAFAKTVTAWLTDPALYLLAVLAR